VFFGVPNEVFIQSKRLVLSVKGYDTERVSREELNPEFLDLGSTYIRKDEVSQASGYSLD